VNALSPPFLAACPAGKRGAIWCEWGQRHTLVRPSTGDRQPCGEGVRVAIEAAGVSLLYPAFGSDFNPIENAFAKLKALLRKATERTVKGL
jgi:transposase